MKYFLKLFPSLLFGGILIYVVLKVPYPETLTQANLIQIISFFGSLCLLMIFFLNFFLKNIFLSSSITLGLIFLLILKALDALNLVTGSLVLIAVGLLASYFLKGRRSLTKLSKLPKLTGIKKL